MNRLVVALLAYVVAPALAHAQAAGAAESYALAQCVVLQTGDRPRLYLTGESGALEAVDARTGAAVWRTKKAAFALLARGGRLLAALPAVPGQQGCALALLETRSGKVLQPVAWPAGGPPGCVGEGIRGSMHLRGFSLDGRDYVRWTSKWWPMPGGAYRGPQYQYPPGSSGETHGVFEADLVHGALSPAASELTDSLTATLMVDGMAVQAAREVVDNRVRLTLRRRRGAEALPDMSLGDPPWASCGVNFTADRLNVLGVWQVPGKVDPFLYHAGIYSVVTGERIGAVEATSWPVASQLCGSLLVAYFPSRVFVMDLGSGKELWTRQVKDLTYRGPYPPTARPRSG